MASQMLLIRLFNQFSNEVTEPDFAPALMKRLHFDIIVMCKSYRENAMLESALNLSKLVTQMTGTTEEVTASSKNVSHRIQEIVSAFDQMQKEIDNARQLISFVHDIAAKSRILGLNASIEATHAAEHGRGFSVIAKEIRKMAEQSQAYATKITDELNNLFHSTDRVNQMIGEISTLSEEHLLGSEQLAASFMEIEKTAEKIQTI